MSQTQQNPALTIIMSEVQLLKAIGKHLPSRQALRQTVFSPKTAHRLEGALDIGFGITEARMGAGLFVIPEPTVTKIAGSALLAHATDMTATGLRSLITGNAPQTYTERTARAAAHALHTSRWATEMIGSSADTLSTLPPQAFLGKIAGLTAIRVLHATEHGIHLNPADIRSEHFPDPHATPTPFHTTAPTHTSQPHLYPHRDSHLDLSLHESPGSNFKLVGHVLRKHVALSLEAIKKRFKNDKGLKVVSFFRTKESAERHILQVLKENSTQIEQWLKNAPEGATEKFKGNIFTQDAIMVHREDLRYTTGTELTVSITKKMWKGMAYYVKTIQIN